MKKIRLEIVGMSYSQSQSGAYALILGVIGEKKRLPIIIGGYEAQAIAIELEKMKPTRPLTHDLFKNFASHFEVNVKEVVINKFEEGIFYSKLVCEQFGKISELDSRTSDAVALAIRFECPIYALEEIIDEAGIVMEDDPAVGEGSVLVDEEEKNPTPGKYSDYMLEELEDMLKKAVSDEDYEEASRLRDEIKRRKKKE
jgi:bifunctional DNase/RNase